LCKIVTMLDFNNNIMHSQSIIIILILLLHLLCHGTFTVSFREKIYEDCNKLSVIAVIINGQKMIGISKHAERGSSHCY
jgi:hypothetical protein